uniref:Puratrophin-1 n=1 Tax=Romanomermis culicivorax TaxID=13658 RepID=A0A915HXP1_ROMCU
MIKQRFDLIEKLNNFPVAKCIDDKFEQSTDNQDFIQNETSFADSADRACQISEYLDPTSRAVSSSSSYINRLNNLMSSSFVDRRSRNDQTTVKLPTSPNAKARQRHVSLETLGSIEDGKFHRSDSLSSKESFQKCLALKNVESTSAARSSQESSAKLEDSSFSSLSSSPPPFPAPEPPVGIGCSQTFTEDLRPETPPADASPALRMQYNVVNELLQTEKAYVRSLQYVVQNYIPEMQRPDLPQHLTGKRSIIFGNLEKLYEFHVNEFFPDLIRYCLKSTENLGAQVARCFLRHKSKFHLYALYSKNKPKSDALMVEYGSAVFKHKQIFLNDKMDLSSYLLKPVQRIGKYTLMMQNLLKATPSADQEQIDTLKQVEEMLIFQLRHGNDLLAMDSIQNCDISLKEQGQLLRQDEFIVYEGRSGKKCIRRIFLFQNLVLFTKPRRQRRSNSHHSSLHCSDVYEYKYSIMMTDVGLTERVSNDSELKFEIWFRRRTSDAIFLILSPSGAVKKAWVDDLSHLLWQQAFKNREDRLTEMSSMGIGTKLCRDLTHSEDRIQDRAVDSGLLTKSSRSKTVLSNTFDVNSKFNLTSSKRPQSLISVDSSNSSSNSSAMTNNGHNSTSLFSTTTPMSSARLSNKEV